MGHIRAIEHVQLAMPAGAEDQLRNFYGGVLGLTEVPKPDNLAGRGGVWFVEGSVKVHLGVDDEFRPARKAHVAFLVDDLQEVIDRCRDGGHEVVDDDPVDGLERAFVLDPVGNRLELMAPTG